MAKKSVKQISACESGECVDSPRITYEAFDQASNFLQSLPTHDTLEYYDGIELSPKLGKNRYTAFRLCRLDVECLISALTCFEHYWLRQSDISSYDYGSILQRHRAFELHQIFELRKFLTDIKVPDEPDVCQDDDLLF